MSILRKYHVLLHFYIENVSPSDLTSYSEKVYNSKQLMTMVPNNNTDLYSSVYIFTPNRDTHHRSCQVIKSLWLVLASLNYNVKM